MAADAPAPNVLHPVSGILILGLDWLLFSGSAITLGASTLVLAGIGFTLGGLGTGLVQRSFHGDGLAKTLLKGLLAGIAVGIPLPVAGTAVGAGILALSGIDRLWGRSAPDKMTPPTS
jgi:ABC-type Mn2+/Zn2+ transport system permease subunit